MAIIGITDVMLPEKSLGESTPPATNCGITAFVLLRPSAINLIAALAESS